MSWDKASQSPFGLTDRVPRIERAEYEQRRARLAAALANAGFDGAVVWSRGGTSTDRAGYGIYLANYYSPFFAGLDDFLPHFSARGFNAVVLMADKRARIVTDMNLYDKAEVARAIDDVLHDFNVPRGIAATIREFGGVKGKFAIIGGEILTASLFDQLRAELPTVTWENANDLLVDQMMVKSPAELAIIRYGNNAAMEVSDLVFDAAQRQGVTGQDLNILAQRELAARGCLLSWMRPNTTSPLPAGAIYTQAVIGWCGGYFFDLGRARVVQGKASAKQQALLDLLHEFIRRQCDALKPGHTFGEASQVGAKYFMEERREFTRADFEAGILGGFAAYGHGLGLKWGRPYLREEETIVIEPGMYLQVEAVYGGPETGMAEAEVGVEITKDGARLLSQP